MVRYALFMVLACCSSVLSAALLSAKWGTDPGAPVYVGQQYALTLTLETLPNEEIAKVQFAQCPSRPPDRQEHYEKDGRRHTVLYWNQSEARAKLVAIPAGRLVADVTHVQTFGFMRTASTTAQAVQVAAFNYSVEDLPGEAEGKPIGSFSLKLSTDSAVFKPGEVRLLTAELTAHEGIIPADYSFVLEETSSGECYPFRKVTQEARRSVAQAHFVVSDEAAFSLRLKAFKAFDLATRTLQEVSCPPVTLRPSQEDEVLEEDTTLTFAGSQQPLQRPALRFSPSMNAPIVGVLPEVWQEKATYNDWVYIKAGALSGWIRATELKGK